ncbi:MAG: hypothetical protein RIC36_14675 [Rhodospirillales bacterium]
MARKKAKSYPVTGDPWDTESTPWGIEASLFARQKRISFEEARDAVIARYLDQCGDMRPLQALFMEGISPGPKVLKYLAKMIDGDSKGPCRFALTVRGLNGSKRSDGELHLRNLLVANHIRQRIEKGEKYDAAVMEEAEAIEISFEHARKIYDEAMRDGSISVKDGE